jgi:tRNA U55 pseudouridine synthase TruB
MASLERSQSGPFKKEDALTLSALENMSEEERFSSLLPLESMFSSLEQLELPEFYGKLASSGCPIYLKKLGCSYPEGRRLRLYRGGVFFALGEVGIHPDGMAVKAIKQFVLFDGPSTKSESKGGAPC